MEGNRGFVKPAAPTSLTAQQNKLRIDQAKDPSRVLKYETNIPNMSGFTDSKTPMAKQAGVERVAYQERAAKTKLAKRKADDGITKYTADDLPLMTNNKSRAGQEEATKKLIQKKLRWRPLEGGKKSKEWHAMGFAQRNEYERLENRARIMLLEELAVNRKGDMRDRWQLDSDLDRKKRAVKQRFAKRTSVLLDDFDGSVNDFGDATAEWFAYCFMREFRATEKGAAAAAAAAAAELLVNCRR